MAAIHDDYYANTVNTPIVFNHIEMCNAFDNVCVAAQACKWS